MEIEEAIADDGVMVLRPHGRLDMRSAQSLRERLTQLAADGKVRIVIDLELVRFMDSSGLSALISGLKSVRQGAGDLRIARPGEQVRLVLQATQLDRVLKLYDTIEEAVRGLIEAASDPRG